ncbi:hypothetical protein [Collimonas humicola]|uniref:hypothetical protein n=1 Tax=Collimonas humicola TaxID=2825886 RepID=UPI001B8C2AC6|nr:hypothetical protein [Collimonas humicola]
MDWKTVLGALAPTAATLLGGPFAGLAVKFLAPALGMSPDAVASTGSAVQAIQEALTKGQLSADQVVAIKQAELGLAQHLADNNLKLAELDVESAKVVTADRSDARSREVQVKDRTPAHLAYTIIGGFFIVSLAQLAALMGWADMTAKIPPQGWLLIGNISGYLAAEAKAASAYYFGTTSDSGRQAELLAQSTPPAQ